LVKNNFILKNLKMKKSSILLTAIGFSLVTIGMVSCQKESRPQQQSTSPTSQGNGSFVEEFNNVGGLSSKGWVFLNNSNPVGQTGWRQGRYEAANMAQYKFLGPVTYLGFPAYSASTAPTDFVSCDVTAVNDFGKISSWLISPEVPMKNGDKIIFYTRATADQNYPVYTKDRMQVWANVSGSTVNIADTGTGNFTKLLLDINPTYKYNDPAGPGGPGGYPQAWTKYTITISGLPAAGVPKARFGFRYLGEDAGLAGGSSGDNFPTIVGVDSLAYVRD